MITEYADYTKHLINDLPGCHVGIIKNQLAESTRSICKETECFKVVMEETLDANKTTNELTPDYEATIGRIYKVFTKSDGSSEEVEQEYTYDESTNTVTAKTLKEGDTVFIRVALIPFVDSCGIEPKTFNRIYSAVKYSTLYELLKTPKKPYTNYELSRHYGRKMNHAINDIKKESIMNYTNKPLRIKLPGVF